MHYDSTFSTDVEGEYPDYLRDESRRAGRADGLAFPSDEDEIKSMLAVARERPPLTLQGARTGITAGAVPEGGTILNLSRMNRVLGMRRNAGSGGFYVTVQPGIVLSELREAIARKAFDRADWAPESRAALEAFREAGPHVFPPDPTEVSASIGGMASCNASGARSFLYGATRNYVQRARIVLADGGVLDLSRDPAGAKAASRSFSLETDSGRTIAGQLPSYVMPDVKNAAGYFAADDMDLLDAFIGSEGTLGIFSELELRLLPTPAAMWGLVTFLPSTDAACRFVRTVRGLEARPTAIEFFDARALDMLRRQKQEGSALDELPELPAETGAAVYVEYYGPSEDAVEEAVMAMSEAMLECGGDEDATWLASDAREMERLKTFRHAVPESVNRLIDERRKAEPQITKLGTDLSVPDDSLPAVMSLYGHDLSEAGLDYVIFGHIGNNHVHVNIIANDMDEYARGKQLYLDWARRVVDMGGSVSAEHGIGKLKTAMLEIMYGADGIDQMRRLKALFDPEGLLNRGNLFEWTAS